MMHLTYREWCYKVPRLITNQKPLNKIELFFLSWILVVIYTFRTQKTPIFTMGVFQWNFIFVGLK